MHSSSKIIYAAEASVFRDASFQSIVSLRKNPLKIFKKCVCARART